MKKGLKGLGLSLCAMLLLAGCSCKKEETRDSVKANINNGSDNILSGLKEGTNNITLQSVYDDLKVKLGNEYAANKLLDIIASKLLNGDDWQKRYDDKMEEKLLKLVENSSYQVNGEFSEELLVKTLESQLYSITCDQTPKYGPIYEDGEKLVVDKYFQCDYTDYQEKALRMEVLTELLNEKYIYDKAFVDKSNLLDTKKTRIVEYIAISSSEEYSFEFITDAVSKLANENKTLEEIAVLWEEKLIEELEKKI